MPAVADHAGSGGGMSRYRRSLDRESGGDVPGRHLPVAKILQDLPPGGISQRPEHGRLTICHDMLLEITPR
jgi:hypothetical protein